MNLKTFEKTDLSTWKKKVITELKDLDYAQTLLTKTPENIEIQPIYTSENRGNTKRVFRKNKGWKIVSSLCSEKYYKGVDCLYGDFDQVVGLEFPAWIKSKNFLEKDYSLLSEKQDYLLENSPITDFLEGKTNNIDLKQYQKCKEIPSHIKSIMIDASLYQEAGANIVEQIAFAISEAVEYLEALGKEMSSKIYFKFSVSSNYFFEIAKLRAFRFAWETVLNHYGLHEIETIVLTENSSRNKAVLDQENNLIRLTSEAMSAIIGGCDYLHLKSYQLKNSKEEFQNLSKNIQILLKEESYLNQVNDPYGGSYYIESLTQEMTEKALVIFKDIEQNQKGLIAAYQNGWLKRKIEESHQKEVAALDAKEQKIVGVNVYQNPKEEKTSNPKTVANSTGKNIKRRDFV